MENIDKYKIAEKNQTYYFKVRDGLKLFIYEYCPANDFKSTIFIISGITGINHNSERNIIEQLSNGENRIVVIHPRGTGCSEGKRGDILNFEDFVNDYFEIILNDRNFKLNPDKVILFGHSMSVFVLLAIAYKLKRIGGAILINPPYIQKKAKGMTPSIWQYFKYACYMIFAPHKPIVNMAGNPSMIEDENDRIESQQRLNDPLLVKYFSMYYMNKIRALINNSLKYCKNAEYPLLLVYGIKDSVVDKKGCDLIFENWKAENKKYVLIKNGSHGKSTVMQAKENINDWVKNLNKK